MTLGPDLETRLTRLEEIYSHQQKLLDDLSEVVRRQQLELDQLAQTTRRALAEVEQTLDRFDTERRPEDEKPPHY